MKQWLLCVFLLACAPYASAEKWPERGYYQVDDAGQGAQRVCRLKARVMVDGEIFALVLTRAPGGRASVQFLAQDQRIVSAETVIIGVDGEEVFRFVPQTRDASPELPSVYSVLPDAGPLDRLQQAAKGAEWLQVVALPYNTKVPAEGLLEGMNGLDRCATMLRL